MYVWETGILIHVFLSVFTWQVLRSIFVPILFHIFFVVGRTCTQHLPRRCIIALATVTPVICTCLSTISLRLPLQHPPEHHITVPAMTTPAWAPYHYACHDDTWLSTISLCLPWRHLPEHHITVPTMTTPFWAPYHCACRDNTCLSTISLHLSQQLPQHYITAPAMINCLIIWYLISAPATRTPEISTCLSTILLHMHSAYCKKVVGWQCNKHIFILFIPVSKVYLGETDFHHSTTDLVAHFNT